MKIPPDDHLRHKTNWGVINDIVSNYNIVILVNSHLPRYLQVRENKPSYLVDHTIGSINFPFPFG